jgi:hypothetical protein
MTNAKRSPLPRLVLLTALLLSAFIYWRFFYQPAQAEPMLDISKGSSYEHDWFVVDTLVNKGLYKSALDFSNKIYKKAESQNNNAQVVKALIHRYKFTDQIAESSSEFAIYDLQRELKTAKYPLAPVLHSMLGQLYWQYYTNHRGKFSARTETRGFVNDSIDTWDVDHLVSAAAKEYRLSLLPADSLQRTDPGIYQDVIDAGSASKYLRPTLYDFLAHRAIDFFSGEEPSITRAADHFVLDDEAFFSPAENFVKLNIHSTDTLTFKFEALKYLQDLVAFHINDEDPDAFVDADLKRLEFVKRASVLPQSDSLFEKGLRHLAANHSESSVTADIFYELAGMYSSRADQYVPGQDERFRMDKKRAVEICEGVQSRYPVCQGRENCKALLESLLEKSFFITSEQTAVPGIPSKALLSWTNVNKLYFRIVKMEETWEEVFPTSSGYYHLSGYLNKPVVESWDLELPEDNDYRAHSAEIVIPALASGYYMLLISPDKTFPLLSNAISFSPLWSSSISYVTRALGNGRNEYFLFERQTGVPLAGVNAQVWRNKYDFAKREYYYQKAEKYTSDANGRFEVGFRPEENDLIVEFTGNGNHLFAGRVNQYDYRYVRRKEQKTFFFTDRSIYRPGQTVYFKAILTSGDDRETEILKNRATTITFYDVNYQKVSSLNLTSNEFGSVSGSFIAPSSGLTGQMRIGDAHGQTWFSVEEYKRPKFEVTSEPVKGAYRLNDSIRVKGSAKMFAGSPVDGAEVKYRVVRSASYPWWWFCRRGYYPQSSATEITNGTTVTNDTGGYVIPFKALPDLSSPEGSQPVFNYQLYIDVTDITGETHSANANVNVGYVALQLSFGVPAVVEKSDTSAVSVSLSNLSGEPEAGIISYSVRKLKSPVSLIRERQWNKPDRFIYTEAQWKTFFPEDPYRDEADMMTWEKGKTVFTGKVNTAEAKQIHFAADNWEAGAYVLEATTKDKYGEPVRDVRYFLLYDTRDKKASPHEAWKIQPVKTECQPGENAKFLVSTAARNVRILYEIEQDSKILERKWLELDNEQQYIEIPVEEKHRGNFAVHFAFVYHNRAYTSDQQIFVPWQSKELDITFETFRDKLQPGLPEQWKLKIKGPKGEKVAAEMLAAMYDASLDEFRGHGWDFNIYKSYYSTLSWQRGVEATVRSELYTDNWHSQLYPTFHDYDEFNWFGYSYTGYERNFYHNLDPDFVFFVDQTEITTSTYAWSFSPPSPPGLASGIYNCVVSDANGCCVGQSVTLEKKDELKGRNRSVIRGGNYKEVDFRTNAVKLDNVKARKNLDETVFFFPDLRTDSSGAVIINFTMNEALTKWKFMALAHTKDLKSGMVQKEVVTQKKLMVMPNPPRFLREKDRITFTAKVSNLSGKELSGAAKLLLFDAATMKSVDAQMITSRKELPFTAKAGQSAPLSWELFIPEGMGAITWRVVASAGDFTDGEESALPVLSNRMLVTETLPIYVKQGQTKEFRLEKLCRSAGASSTLRNHKLTLEFTSNPAWYAVQALPYMIEYPYECAEQTFSRYYANSIASNIANSSPKIRAIFNTWKSQSPDAFLSNLEKNQELKNVLLAETPWVLDAQDENERKQRVGLLFDMNRMAGEMARTETKLVDLQAPNGGWPWFEGMPDDRYITQYIITGFGRLENLGIAAGDDYRSRNMIYRGVQYLDNRIREDYEWLLKHGTRLNDDHLTETAIQYLYARSYFTDIEVSETNKTAFNYYFGQAKKYWNTKSRYMQGMIALATFRYDEKKTADDIIRSLGETALHSEEMGMYWKENSGGYYWYQAPIETQSLLIEAFKEVKADQKSVDDMRVWLLKNKQTNDWKTTTATANACYALLIDGTSWLATESNVEISLGGMKIDPKQMNIKEEAGTGYFKTSWSESFIKAEMGSVTVKKSGPGISWGALYWQYFEDLDKITFAATPVSVNKKLFRVKNTTSGPVIEPVTSATVLYPGDKIRVRIELRNDRDMEYVHMKDMRASGFEPVNVISRYKWQDGLGYYESTKDASTDFFFGFLPKGTHVFEYALTVIHAGDFSNGITQVQCMYAPEFSAHSEGIRVKVSSPAI